MDGNFGLLGGFCGQIKPMLDFVDMPAVKLPAMTDLATRPNTIPWPPILFAAAALIALGLQALLPLPWPGGGWAAVLAMLGVLGVLVAGMVGLARGDGNPMRSNKLMQWRIILQAAALALFAVLLALYR